MSEESNLANETDDVGIKKRRSALDSSYSAVKYVNSLPRTNFRKSDKISDIVVFVCIMLVALLIFTPTFLLRPSLVITLDVVVLVTVCLFIVKRLGILITLTERQAVLVWDLLVASLVFGILLCLNGLFIVNYFKMVTTAF